MPGDVVENLGRFCIWDNELSQLKRKGPVSALLMARMQGKITPGRARRGKMLLTGVMEVEKLL